MARGDKQKKPRRPRKKRRGRAFIAFERAVLGFGMSVVAFFIERRLIKAIKKGGVTAAARTAAEPGEELGATLPEHRQGEVTTSPSSS
jgi:hypothetical protein